MVRLGPTRVTFIFLMSSCRIIRKRAIMAVLVGHRLAPQCTSNVCKFPSIPATKAAPTGVDAKRRSRRVDGRKRFQTETHKNVEIIIIRLLYCIIMIITNKCYHCLGREKWEPPLNRPTPKSCRVEGEGVEDFGVIEPIIGRQG